ncbi:MAG: hypothetical protein P1V97_29205 [Planctomycetota bacterium]|nr:hypothetical protein [Planctomycetota bacterium]
MDKNPEKNEEKTVPTARAATPISRAFLGASPARSNAWIRATGAYLGGLSIITVVIWGLARLSQWLL